MVFSSPIFLFLFLPLTLLFYYANFKRLRNPTLLVASLIFYGWGEPKFLFFIVFSCVSNYSFSRSINKAHRNASRHQAKIWLGAAVFFNIGALAFFKYADFICANLNMILTGLKIPVLPLPATGLPLGISFFTFQALSYVVDVYRKEVPSQKDPLKLISYIILFPQLIAGPIVRYHDVAKQLDERESTTGRFYYGVRRFIFGLSKKVIIANNVGFVADYVFGIPVMELTLPMAWLGVFAYTLQIYFDFSGYSDMAIGLGRMFGFEFLENFNYPYISRTIREFWQRWHISLSTWFRDYLYIPLGGNRGSPGATYRNLLIVFFLCGLWHGASWNFVLWGLYHGFFLALERGMWGRWVRRAWRPLQHLYVLFVVMAGWVLFRSESISSAANYFLKMFDFAHSFGPLYDIQAVAAMNFKIAAAFGCLAVMPLGGFRDLWSEKIGRMRPLPNLVLSGGSVLMEWACLFTLFFISAAFLSDDVYNPFIYFRF